MAELKVLKVLDITTGDTGVASGILWVTFGEWCLVGGGWHLEGDGW